MTHQEMADTVRRMPLTGGLADLYRETSDQFLFCHQLLESRLDDCPSLTEQEQRVEHLVSILEARLNRALSILNGDVH